MLDNYGPASAGQEQITAQPDLNNVIQVCPCPWCSRNRYSPQTARCNMEYQDPYRIQMFGGDHHIGVAAIVDGQTRLWSVTPQAPDQENIGFAPLPVAVDPLQVQTGAEPNWAQVPAPEDIFPAGQLRNLDTSTAMQNCFCQVCSRTGDADHGMTGGTIGYQDSLPPVELVDPYANQNVGSAHPAGIAATVGYPTQAWPVAPQAPYQENSRYSPLHEVVYPIQASVQMDMVPDEGTSDLSAPERLRRLAGCYVSNPDSAVNGVYVESGSSGRFKDVITIDICGVLRDTAN